MSSIASTSPFSLTFTIRQLETLNGEQATLQQAFANAAQIGDQISFFWNWADESELPALVSNVKLAQLMGFKVAINLSINNIPGITAPPGYNPTFGDMATAEKYIDDVTYLAALGPTYLNIYAESNVLAQYDAAEYRNLQMIYPIAYHAAKIASPTTLVGTSYLDMLWVGYQQQ